MFPKPGEVFTDHDYTPASTWLSEVSLRTGPIGNEVLLAASSGASGALQEDDLIQIDTFILGIRHFAFCGIFAERG
jgi:hypothetical protein